MLRSGILAAAYGCNFLFDKGFDCRTPSLLQQFSFNEESKESKTLKEGFGSEKDKVIFPFICL